MRPYRFELLLCVLLAGLTLAALWPTLHCGFVNYDDSDYVTDNEVVDDHRVKHELFDCKLRHSVELATTTDDGHAASDVTDTPSSLTISTVSP